MVYQGKNEFLHTQVMKKKLKGSLSPLQKRKILGIGVFVVIMALLWVVFAPHMGIYPLWRQRAKLAQLKAENVQIKEDTIFLQKEIERIQNDPEYFEKVARDKYGLLKDNEMVFDFAPRKEGKNKKPDDN